MMRSMFSGVSGLRAHQVKMDVIGNNIANVNTVGFKSGRVTFQEVFSQTLQGAGAPDAASGRGGVNPMQVGLGLGVSAIDTIVTKGGLQRTDNPTDFSIDGDGYFILKGGGDTYQFTRAGNFGVDKAGNLVSGSGHNVYGWQEYASNADGTFSFNVDGPIEPINLYSDIPNKNKRMIAAKATENVVMSGNLDATVSSIGLGNDTSANTQYTVPMTAYDNLGIGYKVNLNFWKINSSEAISRPNVTGGTDNLTASRWKWSVSSGDSKISSAANGDVYFDTKGDIVPPIIGGSASTIAKGSEVKPSVTLTPEPASGSAPFTVTLDLYKLSMFAADSSAKPTNIDGYSTGNLVTFNTGADGIITGIYSNGQQQPLGMLGLAAFENPSGLQKTGSNMFIPTTNSGDFKKAVKAGGESVGSLNPGTLEMSNVDLSKEFTEMITTQRGFQANSRIITAADEMMQELVNLKR